MSQITVKQTRAMVFAGFAWTIWVEAQGHQLGPDGHLTNFDFDEMWRWIGEHLFTNVMLGNDVYYAPEGAPQDLGKAMEADPAKYTAERLAAILLGAFREISVQVSAVTVIRSSFTTVGDTTEATVRAADALPVTRTELVDAVRRLAVLNGLRLNHLDGPVTPGGTGKTAIEVFGLHTSEPL